MYIIVDERLSVTAGYVASFSQEGVSSFGLSSKDFPEWLNSRAGDDLHAVNGFLLGECPDRTALARIIRQRSQAPVIALNDARCLEQTLELFTAPLDDVVRRPVHVQEILARVEAIRRRIQHHQAVESGQERLTACSGGRDPEIDGISLSLPRRERDILEYLVRHRGNWLTRGRIFNAVYDADARDLEDSVVEGHVSRLRKKLRQRLGYDPIQTQRHLGYSFVA